ncbi:lantibiotic dehydratase [Nonomuraea sp. NN258]|uniref:lantibiotic dehydratase n=1 Tax=Nonomuraea antri TaxID=2730852 RepID=UPI00156819EA|nr:lantibiotic dehydratase [Nonomuraea antri]NRQ30668.1 lantibiotic dehydratase [Nonomuraea antri]
MTWLRQVWDIGQVADALEHASPVLAQQVQALCARPDPDVRETRRAVLSVARYLLRMTGRAMPFGLLAGVAPVVFDARQASRWGRAHHVVAAADAGWLAAVIDRLEGNPALLARLPVVANNTATVRGDRLIVPYVHQARERGAAAVEVSLRNTTAVQAVMAAARTPVRVGELADKLRAGSPGTPPGVIADMLGELVRRRALLTSLHAPATVPDALGHLISELDASCATSEPSAGGVVELRDIHTRIGQHNRESSGQSRAIRSELPERMRDVSPTGRHLLALDLRLDAAVALPRQVVHEVEQAALALTYLSPYPVGAPAWRTYHQRFYERYGIGSLVPVLDVVADCGIGWPDGYPGTVTPERRSPLSSRDEQLLALAQGAVLDGCHEVVLNEQLVSALRPGSERLRPPSHLEVGVRVHAPDETAIASGDFTVHVVSVSRAAGVLTGRFLNILAPEDRARLADGLAGLPGGDEDTVAAQLSFPPLDPATTHVTRAPQTWPVLVSLGEHRTPGDGVLGVEDLYVGCDGRRLYLAAPRLGKRLEAAALHALNLRTHTPPLARFLTELSRAQYAQVSTFSWGAAEHLPFLPRVRYGRAVLSAARWRLRADELPTASQAWTEWDDAVNGWRACRRLPRRVHLVEGDRLLPLDLGQSAHRVLLRVHLNGASQAVLAEAPTPEDVGWCGGRAHELVVPLAAVDPPPWPPLPVPTRARIVGRDRGQLPACSTVLLAHLYGDLLRQDGVLAEYLPDLLARLDRPMWRFMRYRDPDHHLRLRIVLPGPAAFGPTARMVSTWAAELRQAGLLRELTYPTSYPETGRWGSGNAMAAAEQVFAADSAAVLTQLRLPERPHRQALIAANSVAIAAAFTGSTAVGMQWLISNIPASAPCRVPRPTFTEAVRIADPRHDWAELRAREGGEAIVAAWQPRNEALTGYRAHFPSHETEAIPLDDVLGSLLHVHFVRACGIDFDDEAAGLYLARCAALAWRVRAEGAAS